MKTRILSFLLILGLVFVGSRAIVRALPGDPLDAILAESGTSVPREMLRAEMGLDRPFLQAMIHDLARATHGDFGQSLLSHRPVFPLLATRTLKTLELAGLTLVLGLSLALLLGLSAAGKPGSAQDRLCTTLGALTAALPTPWLGPILLYFFSITFPIFPVSGGVFLPAISLALGFSGLWARLIRERVREVLFVGAAPGARSRGLPEWKVILKYGLAPASGALLAFLGTQAGALLAGSFITEIVFDWKGMGALFVEAVLRRDYPVVEAATFASAFLALAGTYLGDFLQSYVDPRRPDSP